MGRSFVDRLFFTSPSPQHDTWHPLGRSMSAHMDRLRSVHPQILARLEHLNISDRVYFENTNVYGVGSFGDVRQGYILSRSKQATPVAVKRLRVGVKDDITSLFEKEIYVWSKLKHPNILELLGFAFDSRDGFPMFVSSWMNNGSLNNYLKGRTECDMMRLTRDIASGMNYLHEQGVIHSDLKPENILVTDEGTAVICDFGFSRMLLPSQSLGVMTSNIKGTVRYLAYELVASGQNNSQKSDVWSFGMVIYEMFTRERPYSNYARDGQVLLAISKKELPSFPETFNPNVWPGPGNNCALIWEVLDLCWTMDYLVRPTMHDLLLMLCLPPIRKDWEDVVRERRDLPVLSEGSSLPVTMEHDGTSTTPDDVSPPSAASPAVDLKEVSTLNDLYKCGYLPILPKSERLRPHEYVYLDRVSLYHGDVLNLVVDALVYEPDAYRRDPMRARDGSISTRIHQAAGPEFRDEFRSRSLAHVIDFGDVKATSGYNLPAKYVFHARGPGVVFEDKERISPGSNISTLKSCYKRSLEMANSNSLQSIAFAPISTDDGEFPIEYAVRFALEETRRFLDMERFNGTLRLQRLIFVLPDERHREAYERMVPAIFPAKHFAELDGN